MPKIIPLLPEEFAYLEIGVFEGASVCWVLKNCQKAIATVIDPWASYGSKHDPTVVEARARSNLATYGGRVAIYKDQSKNILPILTPASFDLCQVDGDHDREPVLQDSVLAWQLLKKGGICVWDDYNKRTTKGVKLAADQFLADVSHERLWENKQLVVRKL